ncbi:MAG: RNA polymerase factor sigma-54 [Xanthomonadales bacterium]|nr:RNA polymerase factor sigma-54 [Xanthomonadales bacterium]
MADPSGQDLKAHLRWQLSLSRLDARERLIAEVLIDAVDANGYLGVPLEEIEATVRARMPVARAEIEVVRAALRQFEPVGCASRDLGECLDAQLLAMDPALPGRDTARRIVRGHLELLAAGAHERIARRLGVAVEEVQRAAALIRSLEPRPGARFPQETAPGVVPDVIVRRQGRSWSVLPNPELSLRLTLNRDYLALATRSRGEDRAYLRERLREARWLMRCLAARQQTVLRVATAIFERQRGFLEHGPMALVPLAMREIAEKLGVHESTVSRAVAGKHALTPRGTFALGYFFASGVGTVEGGAASSTAVQEMIRRLIAEEDPAPTALRSRHRRDPAPARHRRRPPDRGKISRDDENPLLPRAAAPGLSPLPLAGGVRRRRSPATAGARRGSGSRPSEVPPCRSRSPDTRWNSPPPCASTCRARWRGSSATSIT